MTKKKKITGYKMFKVDTDGRWYCDGGDERFYYEIGKTYETDEAAGVECSTPFTPEKQLESIKLIVNTKKVECFFIQTIKNGFKISCLLETTNFAASVIATDPVMDIALAKLLIKLFKKSELDKPEVKRILEDD